MRKQVLSHKKSAGYNFLSGIGWSLDIGCGRLYDLALSHER